MKTVGTTNTPSLAVIFYCEKIGRVFSTNIQTEKWPSLVRKTGNEERGDLI